MEAYNDKIIIGKNALITVAGIENIPAKIDTGADSSAIWASHIHMNENRQLEFTLFDEGSDLYTGEKITVDKFRARRVRNSTGHEQVRYRVELPTIIKGEETLVGFTLADRSRNNFPVLIGRLTLKGRFLVDVDQFDVESHGRSVKGLNAELEADPLAFHKKYFTTPEK